MDRLGPIATSPPDGMRPEMAVSERSLTGRGDVDTPFALVHDEAAAGPGKPFSRPEGR
jgi:hypothetical protein